MTYEEQHCNVCNFVSPESTTLLRMKCQCLVSGHWLGSISVCDKQQGNFINLLEGFLLCSLEILHSYQLLEISPFMLPHPSPVLYSHSMGIPFIVFLKQLLCYRKIFVRLEKKLRQNNFEQFSFAYDMVKPFTMTG